MEKEYTQPIRKWSEKTDKLRMNSSQRWKAKHEKDIRRTSSPFDNRRGTDSTGKRLSQLKKHETVAGIVAEDLLVLGDNNGNEPSQPLRSSGATHGKYKEQAHAISAMKAWPGGIMKWEETKRSDSYPSPLESPASPFTVRLDGKEQPLPRDRSRQSSLVKSRTPRPSSRADSKDRDSDLQLQPSNSTAIQFDDHGIIRQDSDSWHPQRSNYGPLQNSPRSDHKIDRTSDSDNETVSDEGKKAAETKTLSKIPPSSHNNEGGSLESQPHPSRPKPSLVDASLIHDRVAEQLDYETNDTNETPDTNYSPGTEENFSLELRPKSAGCDDIKKPNPQDQGKNSDIQNLNTTISPGTVRSKKFDSNPRISGRNYLESPDLESRYFKTEHIERSKPQVKSLGSNQTNSPDPKAQSPDPRGITIMTDPTQDGEDIDSAAWLNSDAPLPGNYKAFFRVTQIPESQSPECSGSSADSLIISPTRTDEYGMSEDEDYDGIARANAENMRMFDEYKANSQLKPTFDEEQKAKNERAAAKAEDKRNRTSRRRNSALSSMSSLSSDGSLLLSPGQYDDEGHADPESGQDDLEKAKEEEENQAALHRIELYRVNYELQRDIEAKEAKFKREIRQAWTQPRPPPTSDEKYLDKVAFEKINSKEIFDEFGDQQRPIRTDPQLVRWETHVHTIIDRARTQFLLDDYRQMYYHADRAFEAASKLEFPPLTARCCYYRGLAMYLLRDFTSAKKDFLEARGCAGLYGISKESIERYVHLIDSAEDEETAILEKYPARKINRAGIASRTRRSRCKGTDNSNESSPSPSTDASTLIEDSPISPFQRASRPSPFSSANREERSAGQARGGRPSQTQPLRRPSHMDAQAPADDPQLPTTDIPNYQPQDEAISEEIRKDIQASKARSLSLFNEAGPADAKAHEEENPVPPSSMASTEGAVIGSTMSPGSARRVPRPDTAPITTAFKTAEPDLTREEVREGEMDPEEIYARFGGRPRKARKARKKAVT